MVVPLLRRRFAQQIQAPRSCTEENTLHPRQHSAGRTLGEEALPQLTTAAICYAWFHSTLILLKRSKKGGELNVLEARELFPTTRNWLVSLSRVQSKFPQWIFDKAGKNPLGKTQAKTHFNAQTAELLRKSAKRMLETFDNFVEKDTGLTPTRAKDLPHSNDFLEEAHATVGCIADRLPFGNPERIANIAQWKHNQGTLRAMNIPLVPSPNTHARRKDLARLRSNQDVYQDIHCTTMKQQLRTAFKKNRG